MCHILHWLIAHNCKDSTGRPIYIYIKKKKSRLERSRLLSLADNKTLFEQLIVIQSQAWPINQAEEWEQKFMSAEEVLCTHMQ